MSPQCTVNDLPDVGTTRVKQPIQSSLAVFACSSLSTNPTNVIVRENRHPVFTSSIWSRHSSSFKIHLANVIELASYIEMRWVAAFWVVALVKNALFIWVLKVVRQSPGQPVGQEQAHLALCSSNIHAPVTLAVQRQSPFPTRRGDRNVNVLPEPIRKGFGDYLIAEALRDRLRLHNKFFLLCHALGCSFSARAFSLYL